DDKGIDEFEGVKAAYEKLEKLLGEVEDAKAYIDDHKLGTEWLRLEKGEKFDAVYKKAEDVIAERSNRFMRSLNILDSIETRIGKIGDLYKSDDKDETIYTYTCASMVLAYFVAGRKDIAERILLAIENKIGREGELYMGGTKSKDIDTYPNSAMAIVFSAAGKKEAAGRILDAIETSIGRNGELYYDNQKDKKLSSETNANMAFAHLLQGNTGNAERILEGIDSRIGIDKCGIYHAEIPKNGLINLNAPQVVSAAHFLLGRKGKAMEIYGDFEKYMKSQDLINGELFTKYTNSQNYLSTSMSAWKAIAYALQDGAKICGLPRD
ncbi:MAG: hypothetical protein WC852_03515, partial [Candidatus Nanoarchaeia archaeon]